LAWGGLRYPWGAPIILWLLFGSAIGWILFTFRMLTAIEPFLPVSIVANRVVGPAVLTGFFGAGILIALTIYIPIYLQVGLGTSASSSGLALMPLAGGVVGGSWISARVMARVTRYKTPSLYGLGAAILALVVMAAFPLGLPMTAIIVLLGITGVGLGTVFSLTTVCIQNAVVAHQTGIATASMNFFRSLGSSIFVAALGALVLSGLGLNGRNEISLDSTVFDVAREAGQLTTPFRWLFVTSALVLTMSFASLWAMEERPLRARLVEEAPIEVAEV
jgi:hypothetical protein